MIKIGMLLPYEDMLLIAKRVIEETGIQVDYLKVVNTVDAVNEARNALEAGAHILIARGYQAKLIQQYTKLPVVAMRLHAQEIGLLIQRAKNMVRKEHPKIGLIVFENMLADMSHMEELFGIDLEIRYMHHLDEIHQLLMELSDKQIDFIIGGEAVCRAAGNKGIPSLIYEATDESVREALTAAADLARIAESEKLNTAQFETVLDTSFNGIIKLNTAGNIIVINKMIENLIGKDEEEVVGLPVEEILPNVDRSRIESILEGKSESYTTSINLRGKAWMLLIAPIQYEDVITGVILSLHRITENSAESSRNRREMWLHGYSAQTNFQNIRTDNEKMQQLLEEAKIYALSSSPVMIYGQAGIEDYLIAEAIHNNSDRRNGPYVSINMRGMDIEKQMEALFSREDADPEGANGGRGAMLKADRGTLFIKGIEHLTLRVQHQILRTMLSRAMMRTDAQPIDALDVRLIGSSKVNLQKLVKQGKFSEELYYMLQGLVLEIPSLNERREDLRIYFDSYLREYTERYNRRIQITDGGYQKLNELKWTGNTIQMKSFCERLVLSASKRSVDEVQIQKLFEQLYPDVAVVQGEEKLVIYRSPESERLEKLLEKHHGNRNAVAAELGISTTTLWRRMKKYGIEPNYVN